MKDPAGFSTVVIKVPNGSITYFVRNGTTISDAMKGVLASHASFARNWAADKILAEGVFETLPSEGGGISRASL